MNEKIKVLTGKRFGRLIVLGFSHTNHASYWHCLCDCGNRKIIRGGNLTSGQIKSCGCLKLGLDIEGNKICSKCKEPNGKNNCGFHRNGKRLSSICRECKREMDKERRQRPEVINRNQMLRKEYNQRPEVKKHKKLWAKNYRQTKKGIRARKEYEDKIERRRTERRRHKKRIDQLSDSYITNKITSHSNLKPSDVTPEMIEERRSNILLFREIHKRRYSKSAYFVYFLRDGHRGKIKIGCTRKLEKRYSALQSGNPRTLTLLGCLNGGHLLERSLHDRFKKFRHRREWFESSSELLEFINSKSFIPLSG